jgi:hypothetical protein
MRMRHCLASPFHRNEVLGFWFVNIWDGQGIQSLEMSGDSSQCEKQNCMTQLRTEQMNKCCTCRKYRRQAKYLFFDCGGHIHEEVPDKWRSLPVTYHSGYRWAIVTHMLVFSGTIVSHSQSEKMHPAAWKALEPPTSRRVTRALENTSVRWE